MDGQPVFVHHFLTYDQFNWMDYASFSMTGKVHVEITNLVSERNLITCSVRPMAYGIHPQISGNKTSFDLDQPRYLVVFLNDEPMFHSTGLMLFAEPPEKNPPKLGDPNVVNIMDYKVDNTGKTVETVNINKAIGDVSARPGGGVLFFPRGIYKSGTVYMKSNVKLYIDADAVLLGSTKKTDYGNAAAFPRRKAAAGLSGLRQLRERRPRRARRHRHGRLPAAVARLPARHLGRQGPRRRWKSERSAWNGNPRLHRQQLQAYYLRGLATAPLRLLDHRRREIPSISPPATSRSSTASSSTTTTPTTSAATRTS